MSASSHTIQDVPTLIESEQILNLVFKKARTHNQFLNKPVPETLLRQIYEYVSWGPTSMNSQPLRVRFMASTEKREALAACVYPGNKAKVMSAPVCAVFGMDLNFPSTLPAIFPHKLDAQAYYEGKPMLVESTAFRNSSLQAAYFLMVARLLGLDCGPMSGFDHDKVDALCWAGVAVKTNFLCNLGYGDSSTVFARSPRFKFEEVCDVQ
ncbi:MAG: malonic semialdehyde reductase [Pseudomonadota bacterium]